MMHRRLGATAAMLLAATVVVASSPVAAEPVEQAARAQVTQDCPDRVDRVELTSVEQTESLLVGTWIRCDGTLLPSLPGDDVGIELAADGTFSRVYEVDGSLVRTEGLLEQGTWRVIDTTDMNGPGSYQLDLTTLGSGTVVTQPEFYGTPTQLLQTPHMGESAAFVPWTGAPPTPGVPPDVDDRPCGLPTDPVEPTSVAEVEQLLVNTWVRCGDASALGPLRPGEVGIEMRADGRFHRLYDDGQGGLIRASGEEQEGTWTVLDVSDINERPTFQLDLAVLGQGTSIGAVVLLRQPTHLRFLGMGGAADYQLWSGAPPVPGDPPSAPPPPPPPPIGELPATGTTGAVGALALAVLVLGFVLTRVGRDRASSHDGLA